MSMQGTLQNQKYQTYIDVCNSCAEACGYCATCDLQEQDVKAMASCVQIKRLCQYLLDSFTIHVKGIANMQTNLQRMRRYL
jgi:sulfur relay (sulfurtransferase) complex TusBCD TusD component (DsrE family)